MPRQPRVRSRWGIGAIRLARAAAFVILVIGIAETLTLVLPKGSALYVYLGAFGLAVVAVAAITRALRPRRPRPMIDAPARPLLPPAPPPVDPHVDEELAAAKAVIGDLYARIDEEVQLRNAAADVARASEESLAAMTLSLDAARAAIEDGRGREAKLRMAADDMRLKLQQDLAEREASIAELTAREAALRQRTDDVHARAEAATREAGIERSRADAAEQRSTKLQRETSELRQSLSRAAATVVDVRTGRAAAEDALRAAQGAVAEREAAIADLTAHEIALRQTAADEEARAGAALAKLTAALDAERARAKSAEERAAKLQRDTEELRQSLARAVATVTEITTARMTAEDAQHRAVAAAAEEKAQAEATIADLTAREIALRQTASDEEARAGAALAELTANLDAERIRAESAEERAAKLQRDTDELRQSLARAVATVTEITTARMTAEDAQHRAVASAADLNARLEAERVAAEQARAAAERLQKMYDELRQSMGEQLEAATAEIDAGRRRGVELQRESASLRDELAARDQQWDAKLTDIVAHLASDHEADIGQATLEKEEARAETRALAKKLGALQERLDHDHQAFRAARDKWIAMQKEREARLQQAIADLIRQLAEVRAAAATEIAALRGVPRRRVLIVHRDAALRDLSRRTLEPLGYEVLTAADGLEGLRVATAQKPDAVIAETLMPKMDGRAMMAFLQSRADTAGIRVALMAESTPDAVALQSTVASVLER